MSSLLEVVGSDPVIQELNSDSGFNILADPNEDAFITISEIEGPESEENPGNDVIVTGRGFDVVFAGDGDDIIVGGDGADLLDGGAGSDIIRGGTGEDIIIGGTGADILIGGTGADIFQFDLKDFANGEVDRILDFEVGVDSAVINGLDPELAMIDGNEVKYNGETIIRLSGDVSGIQGEATDEDTFELF